MEEDQREEKGHWDQETPSLFKFGLVFLEGS